MDKKPIIQLPFFQPTRSLLYLIGLAMLCCLACDDVDIPQAPKEQTGGQVTRRPDTRPNPEVISTLIIVPPLLNCGESVTVKGFIPGAQIRIYQGGTVIGNGTGHDPESQTFAVSPALVTGQIITATQEFDGTESAPSAPNTVQDVNVVYPAGLPKPNFPFLYLYDCGIATHVNNLPPGGQLRVFQQPNGAAPRNTVGSANGVAAGQSIGIGPPFQSGHLVSAESQICTDISPLSDFQTVQPAPSVLPVPSVDPLYEQANFIVVHSLVNGARCEIARNGTVIAGFGAPAPHVRVNLGITLNAGDVLTVRQELCGISSPTGSSTVQPCSAMPPARLIGPRAGDVVAHLTDVVAGSRIQIYAGGSEIADGGGSTIALTRPLVDGETLVVVQSLNGCYADNAYIVVVGSGLDDPGVAGPCGRVNEWEYGHRGDPTPATADVSAYFNSPDANVSIPMNAVPLHGIVRYPNGPGPFPLVLIVHGNHDPTDPSYPGYNYLLEHLASQCMIVVSVEEDFLNGWVGGEMDARGIVLLRHLQLWREWNRTPGHQFYGKVDMGNIGLAGHSRGGEAVVVAQEYNKTRHVPTDPAVSPTSHNFNFGIKSLYAIAPVDGQIGGGGITMSGADYYIMHGTHDGDVSDFQGQKTYNRALPVASATNSFKGLLWVYGANHGQWNTGWGTCCESAVPASVSLISAGDQQQIGKIYMGAFFIAGLKGWSAYRTFLNGEVTFVSLPASVTRVFQYQDPRRLFVNHFEEDGNVATTSLPGGSNSAVGTFANYVNYGFSDFGAPHHLWGQTSGLIAGWNDAQPEMHIQMPGKREGRSPLPDYEFLAFHTGQTHETVPNLNSPAQNRDFVVQLNFGSTPGPEVEVSDYQLLIYPLITASTGTKSVQQTVRIPVSRLTDAGRFRLQDVSEIILKFNQSGKGNVAIDEIQFTN